MIIHNYVTDVFYCLLFSTIIILVSGLNSIRLWQVHTSTLVERVQFRFIIEGEICLLYLGQIFQIWVIDIHVCCGSVLQYNNQYLFNYYIFLYLTSFTKSRMYWFSSGRFFCSPKSYKISYIQSIIISLSEKKNLPAMYEVHISWEQRQPWSLHVHFEFQFFFSNDSWLIHKDFKRQVYKDDWLHVT